jgi:hypothetical protein
VDDATGDVEDTYMLSPHFEVFVSSLFAVSERCVPSLLHVLLPALDSPPFSLSRSLS